MVENVEKVSGSDRKKTDDSFSFYDFFTKPLATSEQSKRPQIKDSQSSAKAKEPEPYSSSEIINLGKKVWNFFCTPLASSASTGTSGKPGGDGINPIGSPSLETPFQIDKKQFDKCMKELQELLKKITGVLHEVGDEMNEAERVIIMWLVKYLKKQKEIREEGARDIKTCIVRQIDQGQEAQKKLVDVQKSRMESDKQSKFWETVNSVTFWLSTAMTVVLVASTIFLTYGAGIGVMITSVGKIAMGLTQCMLGIAQGVTQLMKANLTRKAGEYKEQEIKLQHFHEATHYKVKMKIDQMDEWANKSLTMSGWARQALVNDRQAALEMISISPPAAPAA